MLLYRITAALFLAVILSGYTPGAAITADSTLNKSVKTDSLGNIPATSIDSTRTDSVQVIIPADTTSEEDTETDSAGITIPANTNLVIYFHKSISTDATAGSVFSVTLNEDLVFDESVIAPKGSLVKGKIIESREGTKLTFRFTGLSVNNKTIEMVTDIAGVEGKGESANIVGPVMFIGGAFHGGTAGNKAPIPGGLEGLKYGKRDIQIEAGTIIKIPLKEPMIIK